MSLTASAQLLYLRMGIDSNGRLEFEYPHSAYAGWMSTSTFERAKLQLIKNGFLTEKRFKCSMNLYRFSDEWQKKAVGTWKAYDGRKERKT